MRLDAHQHFWHFTAAEYDWIDESMRMLRQDFLPDQLAPLLAKHRLDGTILVEARSSTRESAYCLELAAQHPFIKGVVGWLPILDPHAPAEIDRLAAQPLIKGLRQVVQGRPAGFMEGATFNANLRAVAARGLNFDLCLTATQLPEAIRLVDRHPQLTFVLDHIAKPVVQGPPPAEWRRDILALAKRDRVSCKFSGVVTEVPGREWTPELVRPYFDVVLDAFGPRRLMFGSDWPVCLLASEYSRWFEFVESCAAPLSPPERQRLLGDTCAEVYRLVRS